MTPTYSPENIQLPAGPAEREIHDELRGLLYQLQRQDPHACTMAELLQLRQDVARILGPRGSSARRTWHQEGRNGTRYSLFRADALQLLGDLPDASMGGLITDPPYSSGGLFRSDRAQDTHLKYTVDYRERGSKHQAFSGDNKDQRSFYTWCVAWLTECFRVLDDGAPVCVFTDWRQYPVLSDALQAAGFIWRGAVPWDKTEAARPEAGRFRNQAEYVLWGSKGHLAKDYTQECLAGVIRKAVPRSEKRHIAGKPLQVMRSIVRIGANRTQPILDPFCGSGQTLAACVHEGLSAVGMELLDCHFETAIQEVERALAQPGLLGEE